MPCKSPKHIGKNELLQGRRLWGVDIVSVNCIYRINENISRKTIHPSTEVEWVSVP